MNIISTVFSMMTAVPTEATRCQLFAEEGLRSLAASNRHCSRSEVDIVLPPLNLEGVGHGTMGAKGAK